MIFIYPLGMWPSLKQTILQALIDFQFEPEPTLYVNELLQTASSHIIS